MMKGNCALALGVIALLSACANVDNRPSVAYFDPPAEYKMKSAGHWRIIADDIATQVAIEARRNGQPVFVSLPERTPFARVFTSQLRSALHARGIALAPAETGALTLSVTVDEVTHITLDRYIPGTLSALAAGVLVARNPPIGSEAVAGMLVAADAIKSLGDRYQPLDTEVVMTITLSHDAVIDLHRTDIYYIDGVDSSLFVRTGKTFPVISGE